MENFERFKDRLIYDFSLRTGGVSTGCYASMNLSPNVGDSDSNVRKNFLMWLAGLGVEPDDIVMVDQTHTVNILSVDESYKGFRIFPDVTRTADIDGMVTNCEGLALVTSHADCVPLYFYDPVKKAIGLAHAGWRGTTGEMARLMIERMNAEFGCIPEDLYARVGPCISQRYFECDGDVIEKINAMSVDCSDAFYYDAKSAKYHVSLSQINRKLMIKSGVLAEHIDMADECTYANSKKYFSHRRDGLKRGGHKALLMIKRS